MQVSQRTQTEAAWEGDILIEMKQESVQAVLYERPEEQAKPPVRGGSGDVLQALGSKIGAVADAGQPKGGDHPPRRLAERLQDVSKQRRGCASLVVARAVDLFQVELLAEAPEPDLGEEWPAEVQELVLLVVVVEVRLLAQVLFAGHAGSGMHPSGRVGPGIH